MSLSHTLSKTSMPFISCPKHLCCYLISYLLPQCCYLISCLILLCCHLIPCSYLISHLLPLCSYLILCLKHLYGSLTPCIKRLCRYPISYRIYPRRYLIPCLERASTSILYNPYVATLIPCQMPLYCYLYTLSNTPMLLPYILISTPRTFSTTR